MFELGTLVSIIIWIIIVGAIFGLLWWLIGYCGLPEPFNKVARVVLAVVAVLMIISILLELVGGTPIFKLR